MEENLIQNPNDNQPIVDKNDSKEQTESHNSKHSISLLTIIALIIGLIAIALSVVALLSKGNSVSTKVKAEKIIQSGSMRIAYINTDTIMAQYTMAVEMKKDLEAKQKNLSQSLQQQYVTLQQQEQDYMKNGDKLTLTQQQAKEKEFKQREQQLSKAMQEQPALFQEEVAKQNEKLLNTVLAFVKDYNQKHEKFNIILSVSKLNGPTLYIDEGLDITDEIINGLNQEYTSYKNNK